MRHLHTPLSPFALLLAVFLLTSPGVLTAQGDSYIYGRTHIDSGKTRQWRLNLRTSELKQYELMHDDVRMNEVLIDNRKQWMLKSGMTEQGNGAIMIYDLKDGRILQRIELSYPIARPVLDHSTGMIYCLSCTGIDGCQITLAEVELETGTVQLLGDPWPESTDFHTTGLDYSRGWLFMDSKVGSGVATFDIKTGKTLEYIESRIPFGNLDYDPETDAVYGVESVDCLPVFGGYSLVRYYPGTKKKEHLGYWACEVPNPPSLNKIRLRMDIDNRQILVPDLWAPKTIYAFDLEFNLQNTYELQELFLKDGFDSELIWAVTKQNLIDGDLTHLTGRLVADLDNDCKLTTPDESLAFGAAEFRIGRRPVYTNASGEFSVYLPKGEYHISLPLASDWQLNCPDIGPVLVSGTDGEVIKTQDILLQPKQVFERAEVSIVQSQAVIGRRLSYYIIVKNTGTEFYSGTLQFEHDARVTLEDITPAQSGADKQRSIWNIDELGIGQAFTVEIAGTLTADEAARGTQLCANVSLESASHVNNTSAHQTDVVCEQIRGSHAPNHLSVAPRGIGEDGDITLQDTTLSYTIHFQNIGDAPARDVVIIDTLDPDLDVNTIHFGAASHDYTLSIIKGLILEFRFEGIELPGKEQDEAASQGILTFDINLRNRLKEGTQIYNRAAIYFDANNPVITNRVLNTVEGINVSVNESRPLSNYDDIPELKLELRSLGNDLFVLHRDPSLEPLSGTLSVHSILGTQVFETSLEAGSSTTVDLSQVPSGHYLIRVESRAAAWVRSVVVMR